MVLVVIAAVLVIVRAMFPFRVRNYVKRKLSELKDYRGHVEEVEINSGRGAYKIRAVKVVKTSGDVPVPFFSSPLIDLWVEWKPLFDGALVGEIYFESPQLNFVNAPSKAESQVGLDELWTQKIKQLFPLKISRFVVHDGEIRYRDFHRRPKIDVVIDQVRMLAMNLTNSKKLSKTLHAKVEIEGRPLRECDVPSKIDLDPYAARSTFNLEMELKELSLVRLNDFAKAYSGITLEKGTLRIATELNVKNGYVEPVFKHLAIFNPTHDSDNPIDFIWRAIAGGLTRLIRHHPSDRFGTRVPRVSMTPTGDLDDRAERFRNAIKAFEGTLEETKTASAEEPIVANARIILCLSTCHQ